MIKQIEKYYTDNRDQIVKKISPWVGGKYNAEDVVQQGFANAVEYHATYDSQYGNFEKWIRRIINNAARNFKSLERRGGMSIEVKDFHIIDEKDRYEDNDMVEAIEKEIEGHPHKQVLSMYFLKQYDRRVIVAITDINENTVKKVIQRFKEKMQEKYG